MTDFELKCNVIIQILERQQQAIERAQVLCEEIKAALKGENHESF